jgi:hypothetical protein
MKLITTVTAGEMESSDEMLKANYDFMCCITPEWDKPRVFEFLTGCARTDCQCGGQIHPKSKEIFLT